MPEIRFPDLDQRAKGMKANLDAKIASGEIVVDGGMLWIPDKRPYVNYDDIGKPITVIKPRNQRQC